MKKRVLFGTDGIRGVANRYPMTAEVCLSLGRATAHLINQNTLNKNNNHSRKSVVIGKDTRLSGYCFEQAIAAGICSMGVDVIFLGPMPTAAIASLTCTLKASAGIMVSASHNSFEDNGIKIFGSDGYKLPDAVELKLEQYTLSDELKSKLADGAKIGKAKRLKNTIDLYEDSLTKHFSNEGDLKDLKIVMDCANGAAYKIAPQLFSNLNANVICIGNEPNGININDNCGALFPLNMAKMVKEKKADFGVAFDGDADRAIFVDNEGELIDGDAIIALFSARLKSLNSLRNNTVVTTVMSNLGLEKALAELGVALERAQVGDRYVSEQMREHHYNFGGEQSGHLIFADYSTTGDGILSAMFMAYLLKSEKKALSEMKKIFIPSPQTLVNISVPKKMPLAELVKTTEAIKLVEKNLNGNGRVFVRYSGTENKARILVEGPDKKTIDRHAKKIANALLEEIA
ncbi:phosphoglucosamine mutase [Sulfobacillus acidophilus]|uniref:Phosphoglucosamine mutase n=1 Tax=Sulfobacillus acidophilus TaxID=53633 RepID=A0ABS3AX57_9FIRM|nr:phosphoglucosamine mutase [Sulfobacillus acidophilus]